MSKILLLEDDLSLIDGLSYSLKKQGFELDIARTIKEAGGLWGGRCGNYIGWHQASAIARTSL